MKVSYTTRDGRMTFEFEGTTQTEIWKQVADTQEIFENTTCTKNGEEDNNVRFVVRENGGHEYFELHYNGNNPKLFGCKKSFGQSKVNKGFLFPHRKNEAGEYLPDNGWMKWDREKAMEV